MSGVVAGEGSVRIVLTRAQALVLFELLARETEGSPESVRFEDPAELHVLWGVEGQLEKQLREIFDSGYKGLVDRARNEVRGKAQDGLIAE